MNLWEPIASVVYADRQICILCGYSTSTVIPALGKVGCVHLELPESSIVNEGAVCGQDTSVAFGTIPFRASGYYRVDERTRPSEHSYSAEPVGAIFSATTVHGDT